MLRDLNIESSGWPADAWSKDLPQMPVEVHGCFAVADERAIHVIGGSSLKVHTDLIQTYDLTTRTWQSRSILPWKGRLMTGGLFDFGLVVVFRGEYCLWHPESESIEGPFPLKLLGPYWNQGKGVVFGNRLILVGGMWEGNDPQYSREVIELDPLTGTERRLGPMEVGRGILEAVAIDGTIFAFGGKVDDSGERLTRSVTDTVECYDVRSDTWRILNTRMPLPRMVATAVRIENQVLIFDGQPRNDALQMSSIWVFDAEAEAFVENNWISPYATWSGGAVLVGETVYLLGGNQLVYQKERPNTFTMQHTIVNRFVAFRPPFPATVDPAIKLPKTVY